MNKEELKQIESQMLFSSESLRPLIKDGVEHNIIIGKSNTKKTITICYGECFERIGDDKYLSPENYKTEIITIPQELLPTLVSALNKYLVATPNKKSPC